MTTARDTIITAATELFVEKGFAGTSMGQVGKHAGVAKSLIYHHFKDKTALWKTVKKVVIDSVLSIEFAVTLNQGLHEFLVSFLRQRFQAYANSPQLVKLIAWQNLEADEMLEGTEGYAPRDWIKMVEIMQSKDEIKKNISAEAACAYLVSLLTPITSQYLSNFLGSMNEKEKYLEMVIEFAYQNLKP